MTAATHTDFPLVLPPLDSSIDNSGVTNTGSNVLKGNEHKQYEAACTAIPSIAIQTSQSAHGNLEWRSALQGGKTLVTVRDVKKATPNYKLLNPINHDFSRYVLPVSEGEIKEQGWLGKTSIIPNVEPSKSPGSSLSEDTLVTAEEHIGTGGEQTITQLPAPDDNEPSVSVEQRKFLDRLVAEFQTVRSFKNNAGEPKEELKLLGGDALEQLESRLSIDDLDTPDSWIPRSPELLRLTGKHPLNAEPNLHALFEAGMITPTKLHFVRNHAAVPQLDWETHTLSIYSDPSGLMSKPGEWSMSDLTSGNFKIVEVPVTMGCDGNRRKEVNMVKRTIGFNWTASGVSTALWRGVLVRDVLLACGVRSPPPEERWYLNFEGADEPSDGPYSTAIPLTHALNPANDVMFAFGMNGRVLHPDHGYPIRVIIPGYVGGRQVKWLKKVWVSTKPNTSHYHVWDNKVIPSFIDSKNHPLAKTFFEDESTACWEQTLQSVICKPAHDERIPLTEDQDKTYTVQGFAFNGGGERIERVELSLDGGKTWRYCFRRFVDLPLRHGDKFWAWIFWSCDVKVKEMVSSFEIIVRAHDQKKNFQPENITWNLTGMMNNSWYRVRTGLVQDPNTTQSMLHFRHPVAPLDEDGGWMIPPEDAPDDVATAHPSQRLETFSLDEVAQHNKPDDAWIILDNKVYDVTSVLSWHPGGAKSILMYAGKATVDASIEYKSIHDNYAHLKRDECLIGKLSEEGIRFMLQDSVRAARELAELKAQRKGYSLQPDVFTAAKLVKRTEVTTDSRLYTFELPRNADGSRGVLGLPIGRHIQIAFHFKDQAVLRSYTPVRPVLPCEEDGTFDLLVKTYMPSTGIFPSPGGTISNYLDCMDEGEEIDIRGPSGGITYNGRGEFTIDGEIHHFEKINLVAGGSGLTPHWQLIHAILSDPADKTLVSLIDSNKTYNDIWMRAELDEYADKHGGRFKLWHILSVPPADMDWQKSVGKLNEAIIAEHFYSAGTGVATFLCGPVGLIEDVALPALQKLGFEEGRSMFAF